jgi:hypothetical protein
LTFELPEVIGVLLEAIYDQVLEESQGTRDPEDFQHRFFKEVTRVEFAMLKKKADISLPVYHHPLPAMKTYRSFMCGASIYEGLGDAKLRLRDHDVIEIRYWHCPYSVICRDREDRICVRSHALTEAADLLSSTTFDEIEDLRFSEEGNCTVFVRMLYTGDLREIDVEDKVIDERPCMHLTREDAEIFLLRAFMAGAEYACNHLPEINVRHTLRALAERIDARGLPKNQTAAFPLFEPGLRSWRKGKNAFTKHD